MAVVAPEDADRHEPVTDQSRDLPTFVAGVGELREPRTGIADGPEHTARLVHGQARAFEGPSHRVLTHDGHRLGAVDSERLPVRVEREALPPNVVRQERSGALSEVTGRPRADQGGVELARRKLSHGTGRE